MPKSLHEFVVESLQADVCDRRSVSTDTGISVRTLEKIARREIRDPGVTKVEILARYFRRRQSRARRAPEAVVRS